MTTLLSNTIFHLSLGGTLLYPTDTIWGIGCDATNPDAIEKIYRIKQRDHSKSMLILCADEKMVRSFIPQPDPKALDLLLHSSRPTTVIFPCASGLPDNLLAADGSIGIRIPYTGPTDDGQRLSGSVFCHELLKAFGRPIVSTSANFSGHPSPSCFNDIEMELKAQVDYIVPPLEGTDTPNTNATGSRIVKITTSGEIIVIRK